MQKLINLLAVLSFLGTVSIIGSAYCLYSNKDALLQELVPIPELPEVPSVPSVQTPNYTFIAKFLNN